MNIRKLHGVGGLQTNPGQHHHSDMTQIDPHYQSGMQQSQTSTKLDLPRPPTWQDKLTTALMRKQAIFVLAAPAAGKTSPLLRATSASLLTALNDKIARNSTSFPRTLYVAPRVQLSNQVAINDFLLKDKVGLLYLVLNNRHLIQDTTIRTLDPNRITPQIQRHIMTYIYSNLLGVVAGQGANINAIASQEFKIKPIIAATYNHASEILKKYDNYIDRVIIDELQEFFPQPGKAHIIDEEKAQHLSTIIDISMKSKKGLVLATGSVHVDTAQSFVDFLEKSYHRNVLFDRQITQVNRSKLTVIPFNSMRNSIEIADLTKKLISSKSTNNVIITFNKKPKPTNQISIITIAELLVKKLPVMHPDYFTQGNDRKTQSADEFAKSERSNPVRSEKPKHEQSIRGSRVNTTDDIQDLMYFDLNGVLNNAETESITTKANPDNLLFQSIIRGVGFIVGGMDPRHTATIQKLFMGKKLQVLFATDAIGVGANVDAGNLFLPDLHKFESGSFGQINTSSLVQLVNRAGRDVSTIPFANIYVQNKDIDLVNDVLSRDPSVAADAIDLKLESPLSAVPSIKISRTHALLSMIKSVFK